MTQEKPPGSLADMARAQQARLAQAEKDKKAAATARNEAESRTKNQWEGFIVDFAIISEDINAELDGTDVRIAIEVGPGIGGDNFDQITVTLYRKYIEGSYPYIYFTCTKSGKVATSSSNKALTSKVTESLPLAGLETSFFEGKVREFITLHLK